MPEPAERARLRAGFGAKLRVARRNHGLSVPELARRAGCSRSLIEQLESGRCRPTAEAVRHLAFAINPDRPRSLAYRLRRAAGNSLRQDTADGARRWQRRRGRATLSGHGPLETVVARSIALHCRASEAKSAAWALIESPAFLRNDWMALAALDLLKQGEAAAKAAGVQVDVYIGSRHVTYNGHVWGNGNYNRWPIKPHRRSPVQQYEPCSDSQD